MSVTALGTLTVTHNQETSGDADGTDLHGVSASDGGGATLQTTSNGGGVRIGAETSPTPDTFRSYQPNGTRNALYTDLTLDDDQESVIVASGTGQNSGPFVRGDGTAGNLYIAHLNVNDTTGMRLIKRVSGTDNELAYDSAATVTAGQEMLIRAHGEVIDVENSDGDTLTYTDTGTTFTSGDAGWFTWRNTRSARELRIYEGGAGGGAPAIKAEQLGSNPMRVL